MAASGWAPCGPLLGPLGPLGLGPRTRAQSLVQYLFEYLVQYRVQYQVQYLV